MLDMKLIKVQGRLDYELLISIETTNTRPYIDKMVSHILFLEINFSIHWSLRQFLFEINRRSIHGDILKKLCTSHHVFSIYSITQKQKFTGHFHKFHIPLGVRKFIL